MPTAVCAQFNDPVVTITFDDGRKVVFVPNTGGFGDSHCNQQVRIEGPNRTVLACFQSDRQHPINHTPFGFAKALLPLGEILDYWEAAIAFGRSQQDPSIKSIVRDSLCDIRDVKAGRWPLPG